MLNGAPQIMVILIVGLCTTALAIAVFTRALASVRVAAAVVLGGALANLADRLEGGGVTDFIDIGAWPSFNLADAALMCGLLVVAIRFGREPDAPTDQARPA
ncbi:MAG: signal peptidase II, partial [Solirubrobacterales bacterium]